MKNWIVYCHVSPSNKYYIGITSQNPEHRWGKNGENYKYNNYFYKAIQKYKWSNFQHKILYKNLTKDEACKKEQELIKFYNSYTPNGYNLSLGGESGSFGYKHTEESKKLISLHSTHHNKGFKMSEEQKQKISRTKTGISVPHTKEHIQKIADANRGKKRTIEQRKRMSDAAKGRVHTKETKRKISETCKQKNVARFMNTPENKQKALNKLRIPIYLLDDNDSVLIKFNSMTECANYLNISVSLVSMIISGKKYSKKYKIVKGV